MRMCENCGEFKAFEYIYQIGQWICPICSSNPIFRKRLQIAMRNAPNTVSTGLAATSAKTGHAYQPELFTVKPAESTPAASR
jgi:hypothetical protein